MKHGIKLRKLQRTSSHRSALLRNLVSALLHHEMIKTTVPKAKEAARMAEKIITLGKKGTDPARRKAQGYLMPSHHYSAAAIANQQVLPPTPPSPALDPDADPERFQSPTNLLPKVFTTLAERYQERPGGYTRIHKYGRRPGDYAPVAIVSLVDGPRDIKFEMAARAAGRDTFAAARDRGMQSVESLSNTDTSLLRPLTRDSVERVLKFRGENGRKAFDSIARQHMMSLVVEEEAVGHRRDGDPAKFDFKPHSRTAPKVGRRVLAGERLPGMSVAHTGLGLARRGLGRRAGKLDQTPLFLSQRRAFKREEAELD